MLVVLSHYSRIYFIAEVIEYHIVCWQQYPNIFDSCPSK